MEANGTIVVSLKLNKEEAEWLKGVMQNPFNEDAFTDNDSDLDKNMRNGFHHVLSSVLKALEGKKPVMLKEV